MGFLDRIDRALRQAENYRIAKEKADRGLASGRLFTADTNILIILAENHDAERLKKLLACKLYYYTSVNRTELQGLLKEPGRLNIDNRAVQLLKEFLNIASKVKHIRMLDTREVRNHFRYMIDLLPRKIVFDVMISDNNSFVRELAQKYNLILTQKAGWIQDSDLKELDKEFDAEVNRLRTRFEKHYLDLCDKLGVDDSELNEKDYFKDAESFKNETLGNIRNIRRKYSNNFREMITRLNALANKSFNADIGFVAESMVMKADCYSNDSDVIMLLMLDAARNP